MSRAKAFLRRYQKLKRKILRLKETIEEIRALAQPTSSWPSSDRVQSSHDPDKIGGITARVSDKETELLDLINDAMESMAEIIEVVDLVDGVDIQTVLEKRYIKGECFCTIADDMSFSERWIHELHDRGLKQVEKILEGG